VLFEIPFPRDVQVVLFIPYFSTYFFEGI
jgi:hypothetical protein